MFSRESNPSDIVRATSDNIGSVDRGASPRFFPVFPVHIPRMWLFSREMSEPRSIYTAASAPVYGRTDVLGIVFRAERATITNPKRFGPAFGFFSRNTTANLLKPPTIIHHKSYIITIIITHNNADPARSPFIQQLAATHTPPLSYIGGYVHKTFTAK